MTGTLSSDLNYCYTLLFTGDTEMKRGCYIRALLCYENCRESASILMKEDTIYKYCFYRALRKEAQSLRHLGLNKRCFKLLSSSFEKKCECHSREKLFVLLQLFDLSEIYEPEKTQTYLDLLKRESEIMREDE